MSTSDQDTPTVPRWLAIWSAWSWRLLLVGALVVVAATVFYQLRVVTVPVFIALLATTVLLPPVHFLERHGFRPALATATVFLVGILAIGGVGYLLASPVSGEFQDLGPQVRKAVDDVNQWLVDGPLHLSQEQLDRYVDRIEAQVKGHSSNLGAGVIDGATIAAEMFTSFLLSIILTFFFVKDGERLAQAVANRFPDRHRPLFMAAGARAYRTLGGYLRGVAMTGLVDATLIGIALYIVGVPLLLPLVVLTFLGAFFPVVGASLAGALAAAVALVNGGVVDMAIIIGAVLVVQQLEGHLLQPLLVGRAVALHPVVILVSLGSGAIIAGFLGAFLAVPVVAMVSAIAREVDARDQDEPIDTTAT